MEAESHQASCNKRGVTLPTDAAPICANEAIAMSAVNTALQVKADLVIVLTATGDTSRFVAKYQPTVPVMAFCTSEKVGRQLQLHKGIFPVVLSSDTKFHDRPAAALTFAQNIGWIQSGSVVVMLNSEEDVRAKGDSHLAMKIVTVK
jgi:pyruvate kinase